MLDLRDTHLRLTMSLFFPGKSRKFNKNSILASMRSCFILLILPK